MVDPEHPSTPAPVERVPDLDLLATVESELAAVDAALGRLDDGTYGTCRSCGESIDDERLAADPAADTCAAHAGAT